MNFKIFILIFFIGCGVKGDPASPKSPALPSLMDHYPEVQLDKPIDEFKSYKR